MFRLHSLELWNEQNLDVYKNLFILQVVSAIYLTSSSDYEYLFEFTS